jgi:hypothetical protein
MKKILLLVEGQSEEIVVRTVIAPQLEKAGLHVEVVILMTKREKSGKKFKGGVASFSKIERDLRSLLSDSSAVAVSTILDYYGLPSDFPGLADRPAGNPLMRIQHVEAAFARVIGHKRFIPHLTLHELETWIFVEPTRASWVFFDPGVAKQLEAIRNACGGAEFVDEGTPPSKRISNLAPEFTKTGSGPDAIAAIGLAKIRAACDHANAWLARLEALGA